MLMSSRDFSYWVEHFIGMVSLSFLIGVEENKTWEKIQHLVNDKIDSQTTFVSKSLLVHIWYAFILSFFLSCLFLDYLNIFSILF